MIESRATKRSHKDTVLGLFEAMNTGDPEAWADTLTEDVLVEYPQSGERFRGIENNMNVLRNYPGGHMTVDTENASLYVHGDEGHYMLTPMFTAIKLEGEGDTVVASAKSHYPDGSDWYVVGISHFRGDRIDHQVLYFAPLFEAPEWRKQWTEPTG